MPFDIAVVRDALMEAEIDVGEILAEVEAEWTAPDDMLRLAMVVASMPEDAWGLVDEETKAGISEVLNV